MKLKNIITQALTIIVILGVSFGIWYLVDIQLSDSVTFDVPVVIKLPEPLKASWIITKRSDEIVKATFEGPKEVISNVMQKQKEISAFIEVEASQLTSNSDSEINFSRTIKDISFETQEGKISESIKVSLKNITEVTFKVSPTKISTIQIYNKDVLAAFENMPDEKDYEIKIENIEPNNIYMRAPVSMKILDSENLFEKISLANIKGRGIENRKYTRRLRIKYSMNSPMVQFYADQNLTNQIAFCDVTFEFEYQNIKQKTLKDVPVNIVLPVWCIENFVAVVEPRTYEVQELTIEAREDILKQLNNTNVMILLFVSEGGIEKKDLNKVGDTVDTPSTKYKLYVDPTVFPSASSAKIEIVSGFTQGTSVQLQKFK